MMRAVNTSCAPGATSISSLASSLLRRLGIRFTLIPPGAVYRCCLAVLPVLRHGALRHKDASLVQPSLELNPFLFHKLLKHSLVKRRLVLVKTAALSQTSFGPCVRSCLDMTRLALDACKPVACNFIGPIELCCHLPKRDSEVAVLAKVARKKQSSPAVQLDSFARRHTYVSIDSHV